MSRIAKRFQSLKQAGRTALVPYIAAGDPQPDVTVPLMHAMVEAGADLLELGVPFSDPMADGPVIQAACERALKHHVSLTQVLAMVAEFRQRDPETPVVLMGYLNPIEVMGYQNLARQAAAAGVDGLLTVDIPPEEAQELISVLRDYELDPIFLLSPTSTAERIQRITEVASGFVYYVSFKGVTGANALDVAAVENKMNEIRQLTDLPIGVGFGIRDAESAAAVGRVADAVVVGSAIVKRIEALEGNPEAIPEQIAVFLKTLREALDKNRVS